MIALSSDATFSGIPNGKYTDAITGDVKNVANGTLSTSGIKGQGDLRVYVLDTELTKAPGMIDGYSKFMSGGCDLNINVVAPTGVTLDKTSAELDLGDTVTVEAKGIKVTSVKTEEGVRTYTCTVFGTFFHIRMQ